MEVLDGRPASARLSELRSGYDAIKQTDNILQSQLAQWMQFVERWMQERSVDDGQWSPQTPTAQTLVLPRPQDSNLDLAVTPFLRESPPRDNRHSTFLHSTASTTPRVSPKEQIILTPRDQQMMPDWFSCAHLESPVESSRLPEDRRAPAPHSGPDLSSKPEHIPMTPLRKMDDFEEEVAVVADQSYSISMSEGITFQIGNGDRQTTPNKSSSICRASDRSRQEEKIRPEYHTSRSLMSAVSAVTEAGVMTQRLRTVVKSPRFEQASALLIFLYSAFIGFDVEMMASHKDDHQSVPFDELHYVFNIFFLIEVCLRIVVDRCAFFVGEDTRWNIFDLVLVMISIIDMVISWIVQNTKDNTFSSLPVQRASRAVRVIRSILSIRIMRVMRFFHELRQMLYAIFGSLKSLFWLVILLCVMLYFFALCFTSGMVDHLDRFERNPEELSVDEVEDRKRLTDAYGSIGRSIYSLYKAMSNGVSWGEMVVPLMDVSWVFVALFIVFISFAIFAVLNAVTGVFVDNAMRQTQQQQDLRMQEEQIEKSNKLRQLKRLFSETDVDASGSICYEEFLEKLADENVRSLYNMVGITIDDAKVMFGLLDVDDGGEVDIEEFTQGLLRLQGQAKAVDMAEIKKLLNKVLMKLWDFQEFATKHHGYPEDIIDVNGALNTVEGQILSRRSRRATRATRAKSVQQKKSRVGTVKFGGDQ